jgi:membrane-associated phospholipid phosphatase
LPPIDLSPALPGIKRCVVLLLLLVVPAADATWNGEPLRSDIQSMAAPAPLAGIVLALGAGAALKPWDQELHFRLHRRPARLVLEAASPYGAKEYVGPAVLGLWLVGKAGQRPRLQHLGSQLGRALLLTNLMVAPLKVTLARRRPDGGSHSFPSGHTSNAFALSTVLSRRYGRRAGVPLYALSSLVAASRLHANRHFASDLATGAALGLVAGWTISLSSSPSRLSIQPTIKGLMLRCDW